MLAVGGDTIGDVQVVVAGEPPVPPSPLVSEENIADLDFDELSVQATGQHLDRVALPGVQNKVSVNRMLGFPLGVGSERILKLNPPEYPYLVENEAFFLVAARRCGIRTAEASLVHDRAGQSGLLVKRFDRIDTPEGPSLLAQEDACQACDRYPADKYNLTTEEALTALAALTSAPRVALLDLTRQVVFAYLTGNGDMHAKNLSVVEVDGEMRASPAYDVPSTHPYGDTTMAMTIDGRDREDITRKSVLHLADQIGLPRRATSAMIDALLRRFPALLDGLDALPFDLRKIHKLRRLMQDRAGKLA